MKLILCPECSDVKKMQFAETYCLCGKSWGKYLEDGLNAEYGGLTIPIGFSNPSLLEALSRQPESGSGRLFEAFVIPKDAPTLKKVT